jgi:uncharacterized alkaline shock family protein YloU
MNVFNRVVMFLLSFILFVFSGMIFLLLTRLVVPGNPFLRAILALYNAWYTIALARGTATNLPQLITLGLAIIGLVLVVLELWPITRLFRRPEAKQYIVRQDTMGQVTVGRAMVRDFVQHEAEAVPGVVHAEPEVRDGPNGLRLRTKTALAWDAEAPAVGQVLQERLKESVQTHLGLPVAEVTVTAQAAPIAKETRRRVA